MIYGAIPSDTLPALCYPERWLFGCRTTYSQYAVEARTWYEARRLAMIALGCGPDEIVTLVNPTGGPINVR